MRAAVILIVVAVASGRALAYPQFQLSRDQTCTSCHLKPAGGGILNENGDVTAEQISTFGNDGAFMYGKLPMPDWLALGGDFRTIWGYTRTPQEYLVVTPMQAEISGAVTVSKLSLHATFGMRPVEYNNEQATYVWSREHFAQWQQHERSSEGLFLRAGRFLPVFGLRFVEHPTYTRRYGGTPLLSETYGASASYIRPRFEAHASGFIKDPLIDPVQRYSGGAAYTELRLANLVSVGGGGMVEVSDYDNKVRGDITAKVYLPIIDVLVQTELQFVNSHVGPWDYPQLVGYAMATYFAPRGVMVDFGYGHYDENWRIKGLDRDCFDFNLHWFASSHVEAILMARLEELDWGDGGPYGGYAMVQGHYRL